MTRLEKLREQMNTTDDAAKALILVYYYIDEIMYRPGPCKECEFGGRDEHGLGEFGDYSCYYNGNPKDFVCPRKSVKQELIEYLNEEE